jgi:MFS superfamily sulfate permease-like transporter
MNLHALSRYRAEWFSGFGDFRREVLAGMVGTFALIPEVIAFSFVAGVDPEVGLFASFVIGIVIAFTGGRPAMISDAAGSVALTYSPLNLQACALQLLFGPLRRGAARRRLQGHTRRLEVRNAAPEQRVRQFSAARTSSSVGKRPVAFFE